MEVITVDIAIKLFKQNYSILRTSQALSLGIAPKTLYKMRDEGILVRVDRGLYRLADMLPFNHPELVLVSKRFSKAVICLISALAFHGMTTRIPHQVYIALPRGTKRTILDYPPLFIIHLSENRYLEGIEIHKLNDVPVQIYNPEKTVADCFAFRNKIGIDVAIEALEQLVERSGFQAENILKYARVNKVENVIRPYLETLT